MWLQLPTKAYWKIRDLPGRATTQQFRMDFIPDALEDGEECRLYMGMGKDPAPDWFIILLTVDGEIILIQGQSKCHDKDGKEIGMDVVSEEYVKRLKGFNRKGDHAKVFPIFILATDATVQRCGKRLREDVGIMDNPKRVLMYNPFGAVVREYYQQ